MHPDWLSNAYLAWDEESREAFFVDSGAPLDPLLEYVEEEGLHVRALLTTHSHHDHVAGDDELHRRYGVRSAQEADWAQSIPTPGHADGREATLVVWSPDYDGKGKALVTFADGTARIVGGSRVDRG